MRTSRSATCGRGEGGNQGEGLFPVRGLAHDLEIARDLEEGADSLAHQIVLQ